MGSCFDDFACNTDDRCIPVEPPPPEPTPEPPPPEDECVAQEDCADPWVCLSATGRPNICGSSSELTWDITISDRSINCSDGFGSCELLFYRFRWDPIDREWQGSSFTDLDGMTSTVIFSVDVYDEDLFADDYITEFQFRAGDGVSAWKANDVLRVYDSGQGSWIDLDFRPQ